MNTEPETPPPIIETAEPAVASEPAGPEHLMQAASARIAELEAERDGFRERWMRAEAEMANVRARAKREADESRQYAVQKFATDVVEAAENIRRGLASLPAAEPGESPLVGRLREGFAGIERNLIAMLERHGIVCTDPTGALFDANLHQAMSEQESAEHPPGTVLQAWTSAWTLHGRLLRAAMVVVAKAPEKHTEQHNDSAAAPRIDTTA